MKFNVGHLDLVSVVSWPQCNFLCIPAPVVMLTLPSGLAPLKFFFKWFADGKTKPDSDLSEEKLFSQGKTSSAGSGVDNDCAI